MAVLVGVGDYENPRIPDLEAPPSDVNVVYELLTHPRGYGFPPENVCRLVNERATLAGVTEALEKGLIARAEPKDPVLFYFSGHGSQWKDFNGDEPDDDDETLVLHDSRTRQNGEYVHDLIDDNFHALLARLYARTENVTVIIDACSSGTVTRSPDSKLRARYSDPPEGNPPPPRGAAAQKEGGANFYPAELPNMVVMSAARDGDLAYETDDYGVFTRVLVTELSRSSRPALTYAQLALRTRPAVVAAGKAQMPFFHGRLAHPIFGDHTRVRPEAWAITQIGRKSKVVRLSGVPLPGFQKEAILRVYDGNVSAHDVRDPERAKARLRLGAPQGFRASAKVIEGDVKALALGDLAVLEQAPPGVSALPVRIHEEVPAEIAGPLRTAINDLMEETAELEWANDDAFVVRHSKGHLHIEGSEGQTRNTVTGDPKSQVEKIVENLRLHARGRALLNLTQTAPSSRVLPIDQTLQLRAVPEISTKGWSEAEPGKLQFIPESTAWFLEASLQADNVKDMRVGGVIIGVDGSIAGFPSRSVDVIKGEPEQVIRFQSNDPTPAIEHILVFGTKVPIPWGEIQARAVRGGHILDTLREGMGGQVTRGAATSASTWTVSHLDIQVVKTATASLPESPRP